MKQPRVPEYREADGVNRHLKILNLFLKDFSLETWSSIIRLSKAASEIQDKTPPSFRLDEHGHLIWTDSEGTDTDLGDVTGEDARGLYAFHIDGNGHLILTYDTENPPPLSIDDHGHLIYTVSEEKKIDLGSVVVEGSAGFEIDETLRLKDGVLSVNTADAAEQDNTLPITSAAVHTTVGNIEVLLQTI